MVDGTDLLARGLANWCSAMVFYRAGEILAGFVALPNEAIYFHAPDYGREAFKLVPGRGQSPMRVRGPRRDATLSNASLCFYGQKPRNFRLVAQGARFVQMLEEMESEVATTRLYNLGGNPMMIRLIDGNVPVDAVFDIEGQLPHDVVPGAFIAAAAGASVQGIDGTALDLAASLRRPAHSSAELRYVVAANDDLARQLLAALSGATL